MDTRTHERVNKQKTKTKAREKLKQDKQKQKHVKQDKKVRKTPILTHFQRKEIKTEKNVTLKDGENLP